jgi:CheY-like chemotaxis protein
MLRPNQTGKKVLLVEDDFVLAETLSLILSADGYMVAVASNGQEALQRLRDHERPDLILLDLMLPVLTGPEFRALQQADPEVAAIPTIVLSAAVDADGQALALGAVACLQKPVETANLLTTVKQHCGCKARSGREPVAEAPVTST